MDFDELRYWMAAVAEYSAAEKAALEKSQSTQ